MWRLAVGLIGLAALVLRVCGIGFGLPELFHPDEPAYVLQALAVGRGLPGGLTFANPPLFKYLLLAEYAGAFAVERLMGAARSPADFVEQFRADPTLLYFMARLTSAVLGALTAVAAAALGCMVGGVRVGLIGGGLTAVAFLLVRDAHFGVNDTLVTLLVTVGLIACVRVVEHGRRRDYVAAGVLAGLAFAAKYDGIALLAPLVAAHVIRAWPSKVLVAEPPSAREPSGKEPSGTETPGKEPSGTETSGTEPSETETPRREPSARESLGKEPSRAAASWDETARRQPNVAQQRRKLDSANLALAFGACAVAALLAFPSLLTEPGRVLNDVYVHLYVEATGGYDGIDPSGGYLFYARTLGIAIGWPLVLASAAGIALGIARRNRASLVVTTLPVAMLAVLGSQQLYFARFALPVLPALLVLAALALDALFARRVIAGAIALLVLALPTVVDSARFDALLLQTDTRTEARQWIAGALPPDALLAVDPPPLGPFLTPERNVVQIDGALFDHSVDEYRALGAEYLVVSSFAAEARAVDPAREARRVEFNAALASQAIQLAQFKPYSGDSEPPFEYDAIYAPYTHLDQLERPGPTVTVYRLTR